MKTQELSKHEKYQSNNPINKKLVDGYFNGIAALINSVEVNNLLDVGCGEGMVLMSLKDQVKDIDCFAIDFDPKEVVDAQVNLPSVTVKQGSAYDIKFQENEFDIVVCNQVLEHLDDPKKAISEMHRVTSKYALLSVPNEPIWRMLNMIRLKYWSDMGNTPGHINHWSYGSFKRFIGGHFKVVTKQNPFPWNMVLCEKI